MFYIDLNEHLSFNIELIRDAVHTTITGSKEYARLIYKLFINKNINLPSNIIKTKFCDVKMLQLNKVFYKNLILDGNCEILCFELIIGPNSGYIYFNKEILLWDTYCHYNRSQTLISGIINKKQEITILTKEVDRSSCRRDYNFNNVRFELNVKNIYFLGDKLEFISGS